MTGGAIGPGSINTAEPVLGGLDRTEHKPAGYGAPIPLAIETECLSSIHPPQSYQNVMDTNFFFLLGPPPDP